MPGKTLTMDGSVPDGLVKPLSPKRAAFVKARLDNPTASNAEQVKIAGYKPKDNNVASNIASELLRDPEVKMQLAGHAELFESVISGTAKDWGKHDKPRQREIALNAAMYGHDKIFGKATVKVEQQVSVVRIAINLSGDAEPPPDDLDAIPGPADIIDQGVNTAALKPSEAF